MDLLSLWLPILVSAVAVFFASFVMWMVLPHHRSDWKKIGDEDAVMGALADAGVGQGQYTLPHMSSPELMKDPEWVAKFEKGPSGMLVVMRPGPMNMGKSMFASFLHNLGISILVAYVATMALAPGSAFVDVFRLVSTTTLLAYGGSWFVNTIWFHHSWSSTLKHVFDALVYGLVTGAVFGAFWPAA